MTDVVREGELILVYIDEKRKILTRTQRGKVSGTDKGYVMHDDIIGRRVGDVIETSMKARAVILRPLLIDIAERSRRATQIIYPKDAGLMIYLSGIGPGSRVGEAGVGTGALTIALASIVGDTGRVYGFDISDKAIECTRENLELAGLLHRVSLEKRDVREKVDITDLDAFFLDIPDPWNALDNIYETLKPSKPVLIFLPTMNQVEKTLRKLLSMPFIDIHVYESLLREYSLNPDAIRPRTRMIGHTGYVVFARKTLARHASQ